MIFDYLHVILSVAFFIAGAFAGHEISIARLYKKLKQLGLLEKIEDEGLLEELGLEKQREQDCD